MIELTWLGWFTIIVIVAAFAALIKEVYTPDIVMLIASGILLIFGALSPKEFLSGFFRDVIVTVAMMCIVVRTMQIHGVIDHIAKRFLPKSKNAFLRLLLLLFPITIISAFINNTPLVLVTMPIIIKWSNDKNLSPSKFLIPLSFAAILGGVCTLIGSSTNIVVDGLMRSENQSVSFSFFELALVGIPTAILGNIYIASAAPYMLPDRRDPPFDDPSRNGQRMVFSPFKFWLILAIVVGMVLMATAGIPIMISSLFAAFLFIVTGLIPVKEVPKSINWSLLLLLGCSFTLGIALQKQGAASYLAGAILKVVGSNPIFLMAGIFLVTMFVTEFVTHNAAAIIVFPIAIEMVYLSGYKNPEAIKTVGVLVTVAAAYSFLTPISYQTNTMVYGPGGYRFTDYTKIGLPLSILLFLIAIFIIPYFWPLR